jgi:hypothetical protein
MDERINKLKYNFKNIIEIRNSIDSIFEVLQTRINKLKIFYDDFMKDTKEKLFVFGLDSFHFQGKLNDIEYGDMKRMFLSINNRMYCEYFKLYKIIVEYISENIKDKKIIDLIKEDEYPIYKDLEPFKEYNFEIILSIHENILILIGAMLSFVNTKENELSIHKSKNKLGLNIDNFISSFHYEIIIVNEKISMFIAYIEFFHKLHSKNLGNFLEKINLMNAQINNEIEFETTTNNSESANE